MNVTFDGAEDVAYNIRTFWFKPERPVRFIAGQFTELYLPHEDIDERGIRRWFTISSSPTEELIGITTKFAAHEGSTFKNHLLAMKPGAQLKLADPMGDFVLPKDPGVPILFVAAGMGITPVRSMVKWLLDTGEQRNITLLYAVSQPEDVAFHDLFTAFHGRFAPHITTESGRLTTRTILDKVKNDATRIYISGPEQMIETFYKDLAAKGFSQERLVTDYFPGYQQF